MQSITRADGTVEKFTWDGNGNLLTYRDGAGTETRYGYDQLNQLYGRRTAAVPGEWGDGIGYYYDRQGRLIKLRNENDELTTFRYDALGQLIEQTGFDGRSVAYEWDDAGRLAASTEAGVETRYERDPMGRLIKRTIGKHSAEQFYYDARGRLVTAQTNSSVVRLHYDDADNLIAEEQHVQPISQKMVPLTDSNGDWILGDGKQPIRTRELTYNVNGQNVVIQDHSAGHYYGQGGVGDQPSHHNVRPEGDERTGKVDGMDDHYYFNCRNKK
ncbi:HNH/endonuclease VII fold putative polymorphic toxin [Caballeronia sp. INDeC2]|uniref:HNH/endonuclease VII fold putative polymorphic toxin n=1 Tax=Caballeronia sp. INDeC2 TaxID=2921747 RepID=UPI00202983B4|nr:HNH/endonuclease VII fold putative polymorphic toxin [Caballeronia sp. INDeC2]